MSEPRKRTTLSMVSSAVALIPAVVILLLLAELFIAPFLTLFAVIFAGWYFSLRRMLNVSGPEIYDGLMLFSLGLMVCLAGTHWFAKWLSSTRTADDPSKTSWRFSWSMGVFGMAWLPILAAMALVGVVHQCVWLATSKENVFDLSRKIRLRGQLNHWGNALQTECERSDWSLSAINTFLCSTNYSYGAQHDSNPAWERFATIIIPGANNSVKSILLRPLEPNGFEKSGFAVITQGRRVSFENAGRLKDILAKAETFTPLAVP